MSKDKVYLIVIVFLVIALIASCALQAQTTSKRLTVSEIVVPQDGLKFVSEDGNMIAKMTVGDYGGELTIYSQGIRVASLSADEHGGLLSIKDCRGTVIAGLGAFEHAGSLYVLLDRKENFFWTPSSSK